MMTIDENEICAKVLVHLISMTVQLKYLRIERFEWLLHVIQYTSNELRINALSTVRHAEFCLPSCHNGYETIHIGKRLVPFITQHVVIFEQDLCQLIDKLKGFTFLDIYGKIHYKKVKPYRLMVQARFPHSRVDVEISRFRLWL
ncbi:unnamed protein product [Rotaria sp. Silwood1]|nr:unnamed protein product [Rotaria sp. Silwood1]CAF1684759.1 unnamed protein product [Rotaria sp. Silwood1]